MMVKYGYTVLRQECLVRFELPPPVNPIKLFLRRAVWSIWMLIVASAACVAIAIIATVAGVPALAPIIGICVGLVAFSVWQDGLS